MLNVIYWRSTTDGKQFTLLLKLHSQHKIIENIIHFYLPTTINVKSNPFLTAFLKTWFGKLAKPTYPSNSFVRLSGTALSLSAFVNRSLASAGVSVEGTVKQLNHYFTSGFLLRLLHLQFENLKQPTQKYRRRQVPGLKRI